MGVPVHQHFEWLPKRPAIAAAVRQKWPVDSHRWLIINPGARWLNKRWPVEHYSDLVRRLAAEHGDLRFAILGGTAERDIDMWKALQA